jgi:CcmD family protein
MAPWGFVALAYGVVWGTIVIYLIALKRRYAQAAAALSRLETAEARQNDDQK